MADIFLSYSREDQITARRYAEALKAEGFSVWWDQALDAGESFDKVTEQALKDAKAVVVLWSTHSVDSRWVRAEATQADRFGTLVPVMIEPCNRPIMFELTHTADLSGWKGDAAAPLWRGFIEGLRRTVGRTTTSTVLDAPASPYTGTPPRRGPHGPLRWVALVAAPLLLVIGVLWVYLGHRIAGSTTNGEVTVAVMHFRDVSPERDQQYWADGMTDEVHNALDGIRGLTVIARSASDTFKDADMSPREVGKELGATHIVDGSIRTDGNKLRITAQLIDTRTATQLWVRSYDRSRKDVFDVQEEIARQVAKTLSVSLGVGDLGRVPGMTRDVAAYELFLQARTAVDSRSPEEVQRGIDLLKQAVEVDRSFAFAWSLLSNVYRDLASVLLIAPSGESWEQLAAEAGRKARELAPDPFFTLRRDIDDSMRQGEWSEAARLVDQVDTMASRRGVPIDLEWLRGQFAMAVGRTRDAIAFQEHVKRRNPLDATAAWMLGEDYANAGNLTAALAEFDRGQKLANSTEPLWGVALLTAMATGDPKQVEQRLDAVIEKRTTGLEVYTAMRPLLNKPAEALNELRRLHEGVSLPQMDSTIAAWAAYFGDPAFALEILRALQPRRGATDVVRYWRPVMKDMRRLPGFKELVSELGLVDYWRSYGWGDFCKPVGETDFECH